MWKLEKIQKEEERWVEVGTGTVIFVHTNYNDLLADLTYSRKTKQNKTQDCGHWLFPVFYCTFERSCSAEARERREERHVLVSIETSHCIMCRDQGTYCSRTCCVFGPLRAAEWSTVVEGCSNAMVGAQLLLLHSNAPPKSKKRKWFWSPSRVNDSWGWVFLLKGPLFFTKLESPKYCMYCKLHLFSA